MNFSKYIFAKVIDFILRYLLEKLVKKYKGDNIILL